MKMTLIIVLAIVSIAALAWFIYRAKRTEGRTYKHNVYAAVASLMGIVAAFGLLLDEVIPYRNYTFEELNSDAGSGAGWIAGGVFLIICGLFAYFAWKKVHKNT